ncbi:MAG TPA: acyltransferase domain-containing protein [Acidobacteriaceae bacterium]|jgi:malonyl CoA-acyl carrier protein transacylase/phosphopantetheinyl transferase
MSERHRLLLLAASSAQELRAQLAVDEQSLLERDDVQRAPRDAPYRLAIVDADTRRLTRARRIVESGASWRGRNDIWFTASPLLSNGSGSVALIFPGIEQRFEPVVDDIAAHFRLPRPELAGSEDSVLRRSISLLAVGRLLDAALRRIGMEPAAVAGHSIGEWNAMISAGLFSTASMDALIASVDPTAFELPGCLFAALGCGVDVAQEAIAGIDGVVISHDNCPHQSIICGEQHAIAAAVKRLDQRGVLSQVLNFRSGFHSPLLAPYLDRVSGVAKLQIGAATVPVWSATTTQPFPADEHAIRSLVIRHLLEPVRFRALIENLYASGIRAFIQAGVGSVTGFIEDTLAGRDYVAVAANLAGQPGLRQLRRTAAALWVEGAQLRLDLLAAERPRPILVEHSDPITPVNSHPIVAEMEALLADATEAAHAVTARLAELRTNTGALEPRQTRYTWTLSLDQLPFVIDHCLIRQPADWPILSDRQPVVPLTTTFELMRDVARRLVPERTPIALRKVSALRWLALDAPLELDVTATFDGRESVEVDLGGYAQATVIVRDQYPDAPAADTAPFANERPSPVKAAQLYADRWLFHGPLFQGIEDLAVIGDDGLRGTVRTLESRGALVDCAGQLMVFWIMAALRTDRYALPGGVDAVEFFGPQPAAGDRITGTVRIRSVTSRTVYADLELADRHGRVYARLSGFENRRFATDDVTWPVLCYPESNTIAQSDAAGWVCLTERWPDAASRELIARRYLGAAERETYRTHAPRGRRHWLMGRIAAKDAVRHWLWARGAGPLFPVEVAIAADEHGRPVVNVPGPSEVYVSIAHSGDLAVAIAHEKAIGIDVEIIEPRNPGIERIALSPSERVLLDRAVSGVKGDPVRARSEAFTRFWTAKEAVSKAEGTGLAGRPNAFPVSAMDGDRLRVICERESAEQSREYTVETSVVTGPRSADGASAEYIVAWTVGWTHAAPALHPSHIDLIAPPLTALRPAAHPAATMEGHGGN